MGNKEILVTLNTPPTGPTHVYFPGDTVNGNVQLILSRDIDLNEGINITLYGMAHVSWTEGSGDDSKSYSDTETFFEIPQVHGASHEQTFYPFSFVIPNIMTLPWSAVSSSGRIEYGVKALIKRPRFHFDKKGHATFTLKTSVSCRMTPESTPYFSNVSSQNSLDTTVGCCCFPFCCWYLFCASEKLRLSLAHPSPRVLPGDALPFTVEVDNSSTSEHVGNGKIQLVGRWLHIAIGSTTTSETVFHEQVLNINLPPGEKSTINGTFNIPLELMPTQVECKVLKLMYKLRVKCNAFRCMDMHPTVEVDVVMGMKGETPS